MRDFDELLDEVLREDARVEPRSSLAKRVLTRVQMEGGQTIGWRRWLASGWMWWVPVAACLGVVLLLMRSSFEARSGVPDAAGVAVTHRASIVESGVAVVKQSDEVRAVPVPKAAVRDRMRGASRSAEIGEVRLPKLETFPSPSVVTEPMRELAEVSRRHSGEIVPGLAEASAERSPPKELKIEPIEIAKIDIAPLDSVKDTRAAKEEQGK